MTSWVRWAAWAALVGGSAVLGAQRAFAQLGRAQAERAAADTRRQRLQLHFRKVQEDAVVLFMRQLPDAHAALETLVRVDELRALLERPSLSKDEKMASWEELKVQAWAHATSGVYALVLLYAAANVQLNVVGRRKYVLIALSPPFDDGDENAVEQPEGLALAIDGNDDARLLSDETVQAYLSYQLHLLKHGLSALVRDVTDVMQRRLETVSVKAKLRLDEVERIFADARAEMGRLSIGKYILPDDPLEPAVLAQCGLDPRAVQADDELRRLLDETRDVLESDDFREVCATAAAELVPLVNGRVAEAFQPTAAPGEGEAAKIVEFDAQLQVPVARVVSTLSRVAKQLLDPVCNQPLVQRLAMSEGFDALGSAIYGSVV